MKKVWMSVDGEREGREGRKVQGVWKRTDGMVVVGGGRLLVYRDGRRRYAEAELVLRIGQEVYN